MPHDMPKFTDEELAKFIDDAMADGKKTGTEIAAALAEKGVMPYKEEMAEAPEMHEEPEGEDGEMPAAEEPPMPPMMGKNGMFDGEPPPPEERRKAGREDARRFAVMVAVGKGKSGADKKGAEKAG